MTKHLVIIGGGAAGFFCAVNAARRCPSLQVTVIEKTGKLLSKVKVSGGGRCNVTHACFDIAEMSRKYPRGSNFVKKTFYQFFTTDTIKWFEERGVKLKKEKDGRIFPVTDSSQTIINCLLNEALKYKVEILLNTTVEKITKSEEGFFCLGASDKKSIFADFVCIATGGYPKATMFDWIKNLGHTIEDPVPSLFTFNLPGNAIKELMGVSVDNARIKILSTKLEQEGPLLITHWGISGPAVLKLSAWAARELRQRSWNFKVTINWLPAFNEQTISEQLRSQRNKAAAQKISGKNQFGLPSRLWDFLIVENDIEANMRWADMSSVILNKLAKSLCSYECEVKGKTTFKDEFVTAGGVKLNEVDANTMMSKKTSRLFFAGEVLDVDGVTGGFNFQHAWTSGWIAANEIANMCGK